MRYFILVGIGLVFLLGCNVPKTESIYKAKENAADEFVKKMNESLRNSKEMRIGILSIEDDNGDMRETLYNALTRLTNQDIIPVNEMENILKAKYLQMKYSQYYDKTLSKSISEMKPFQCLITGRMIGIESKSRSARVSFQGKVLDLHGGSLSWSGSAEGKYYKPVDQIEILGVFIVVAVIFGLVMLLSQHAFFWGNAYPEKEHRRVLQVAASILTILGFSYYYLLPA